MLHYYIFLLLIGIVGIVIYWHVLLLAVWTWNSCAPSYANIPQTLYHLFRSVNVRVIRSLLKVLVIRSYTTAGGSNKPVWLQYLDWWDEETSYLFLVLYRVWYDVCLGCYCAHDTWHKRTQTDYLLVFNWTVPCAFFTVTSCEISTLMWRGILCRQSRTTGEKSCLFRSMELCSNNSRLPCVKRWCPQKRNSYSLMCLVFCSWWWVTDNVWVWTGSLCVCMCFTYCLKSTNSTTGGCAMCIFSFCNLSTRASSISSSTHLMSILQQKPSSLPAGGWCQSTAASQRLLAPAPCSQQEAGWQQILVASRRLTVSRAHQQQRPS